MIACEYTSENTQFVLMQLFPLKLCVNRAEAGVDRWARSTQTILMRFAGYLRKTAITITNRLARFWLLIVRANHPTISFCRILSSGTSIRKCHVISFPRSVQPVRNS